MSIRNILMVVSLALSVLIGMVLARRDQLPQGSHKLSIGMSFDTLNEERWAKDHNLFEQRCKELGADVKFNVANGNDNTQLTNIQSLLANGVDVLVIVPHNGEAMKKAVELAHEKGVPVIAYDRLIMNCDLDLYTSFDAVHIGEVQARYLVDHLPTPGHGTIIRIYGSKADHNADLLKEGQDKVLKPYVDRKEIRILPASGDWTGGAYADEQWSPASAKKITNAVIANATAGNLKIDGVLASNDGTAGGAIQALEEWDKNEARRILVTGQDADLIACRRIVAGAQTMTVYKPLKVLAYSAAEAAVRLAEHKPVFARDVIPNGKADVPAILNEVVAADKGNMIDTVIKDKFLSYDDVYAALPENQRPPRLQGP
jgi:D-xylose transport system substrate-binding protein